MAGGLHARTNKFPHFLTFSFIFFFIPIFWFWTVSKGPWNLNKSNLSSYILLSSNSLLLDHHPPLSFFFLSLPFSLLGWVPIPAHTAGSLLNLPQPATSTSSFPPFITLVTRNGFIPLSFPSFKLESFASLSEPWMTLSWTPRSGFRLSSPTSLTRLGPNRLIPVRPEPRAATRKTSSPGWLAGWVTPHSMKQGRNNKNSMFPSATATKPR